MNRQYLTWSYPLSTSISTTDIREDGFLSTGIVLRCYLLRRKGYGLTP